VLRVIVTNEQVTTPQHTEQQGNATAAAVGTSYLHRFEPTPKTIHAGNGLKTFHGLQYFWS
jgi:hypothetical protein